MKPYSFFKTNIIIPGKCIIEPPANNDTKKHMAAFIIKNIEELIKSHNLLYRSNTRL